MLGYSTGLTLVVFSDCWDEPTFVQPYGTTELGPERTSRIAVSVRIVPDRLLPEE